MFFEALYFGHFLSFYNIQLEPPKNLGMIFGCSKNLKSWDEAKQPVASMSSYSSSVMCIGINISSLCFC